MIKICPRCHRPFECRPDDLFECHCITVTLDASQLRYLGNHYKDCLCHNCLLAISKTKPA